jgi:hypothetical protein
MSSFVDVSTVSILVACTDFPCVVVVVFCGLLYWMHALFVCMEILTCYLFELLCAGWQNILLGRNDDVCETREDTILRPPFLQCQSRR